MLKGNKMRRVKHLQTGEMFYVKKEKFLFFILILYCISISFRFFLD